MPKPLYHWLKQKFFKDEIALQQNVQAKLQEGLDKLEESRRKFEGEVLKYGMSVNVVDLVREQLKGFNPRLLDRIENSDQADILAEIEAEEGGNVEAFLAECKQITTTDAFLRVCNYLIRNQVIYTAKEARAEIAINFGRATINGVSLMREEIERMAGIWEERSKAPEPFDKHEAI